MSANLPQQRGASDLHAAAQLRRPGSSLLNMGLCEVPAANPDAVPGCSTPIWQRDEHGDQSIVGWQTADDEPDAYSEANPSADELLGPVPPAVVESPAVVDPCVCPPAAICDEDGCAHCAALDPALPCPHDTFAGDDEDQVDEHEQVVGMDGRPAFDVPVDQLVIEPCAVLPNAVHGDGPCGPQHSVADLELSVVHNQPAPVVDEDLVDVAADQLVIAAPAAGCQPCDGWGVDVIGSTCASCAGTGVAAPPRRGRPWARGGHDERSRLFGARQRVLVGTVPLHDHLWPVGPVLDQGVDGDCVGFGIVDAVNAMRLARDPAATLLGPADAQALFARADVLDNDGHSGNGTTVLAGMQAAVEAGWFGGYLWAFGTRDIAQVVLQLGPVVVGIPWPSGMDADDDGRVVVAGEDVGAGHCLAIVGLALTGPAGEPGPFFAWQQSYGAGYGAGGIGWIHHAELAALLHAHGEAAVPTIGAHK